MNATDLIRALEEGLREIPLLDIHTHLDAAHLTARGLHDVLLYHMIVSDLGSAGCPSRARLSEDPDEDEAQARLAEAIPYVALHPEHQRLLGRAHHPARPLRLARMPDHAGQLAALATPSSASGRRRRVAAGDPAAGRGAARLHRVVARPRWRRPTTSSSTRWNGPSSRAPSGASTTSRSTSWSAPGTSPGRRRRYPSPSATGRPQLERTIRTLDDVHAAIAHYVRCIPYDRVLSTAQHISTDLNLRPVSEAQMAAALRPRDHATPVDRDVYASYILEAFLTALEHARRPDRLPVLRRRRAAALRNRQQAAPGNDLRGGRDSPPAIPGCASRSSWPASTPTSHSAPWSASCPTSRWPASGGTTCSPASFARSWRIAWIWSRRTGRWASSATHMRRVDLRQGRDHPPAARRGAGAEGQPGAVRRGRGAGHRPADPLRDAAELNGMQPA